MNFYNNCDNKIGDKKSYTVIEYGGFSRGKMIDGIEGCQVLPENIFDILENFVLSNNKNSELLSLSVRRGVKIITAKNYVGIINIKSGGTNIIIEILPKIAVNNSENEKENARKIFIQMLRNLNNLDNISFKKFNFANLSVEKLNLFEVFIKMFLDEIGIIIKKGLKFNYNSVENNQNFFKGKLNFTQNVRYNSVHKERFFICYDEYNLNNPENRLIKSALRFMLKSSNNSQNKKYASRLLQFFDGVNFSENYKLDFDSCVFERSANYYNYYETAIEWCKIFLMGNSFSNFSNLNNFNANKNEIAFALLFPMEKMFENFIAEKLKENVKFINNIKIKIQDNSFSLFESPKAFNLRPDIVLYCDENKKVIILDTKWKLLSNNKSEISQNDIYQMYVYAKKYRAKDVVLLYPLNSNLNNRELFGEFKENKKDEENNGVNFKIFLINLEKIDESIKNLLDLLNLK